MQNVKKAQTSVVIFQASTDSSFYLSLLFKLNLLQISEKMHLNGLMASLISTLYRVFDSLSGETTDYKIGVCCMKY